MSGIIKKLFSTLGFDKLQVARGDEEESQPDQEPSPVSTPRKAGSPSGSNQNDFDPSENSNRLQTDEDAAQAESTEELIKRVPEVYNKENNHIAAVRQEFCDEALNTPVGITGRCEYLDRLVKSLDRKLASYLIERSQIILDGMQKIRTIEQDIKTAQVSVKEARARTKIITEQFESSLLRLSQLNRKKKRVQSIGMVLQQKLKMSMDQYKQVLSKMKESMFSKAYETLVQLQQSLSAGPSLPGVIGQLRDKVKTLDGDMKIAVQNKLGEMIWKFSKAEYAELAAYYEMYADRRGSEHGLQPLFEDIRIVCKRHLSQTVRSIILSHTKGEEVEKKAKVRELSRKLDIHELVDCLNEIFKMHANMMYAHHLIIAFHERKHSRLRQEESKQQKSGVVKRPNKNQGIGFHQAIKTLLMDDRKVLWESLQRKVIAVISGTSSRIDELSIPELFEVLALCSKYLQLGEEFSGVSVSELREIIVSNVCKKYVDEFHTSQLKNLKCVMETDLWKRLPLPDNYELPEFKNFMMDYPSRLDTLLKGITVDPPAKSSAGSAKGSSRPVQGIFSQMVNSNPFSVEYRLITTKNKANLSPRRALSMSTSTAVRQLGASASMCLGEEEKGMENLDEKEPGESSIVIHHSLSFKQNDVRIKNQIICSPGLNLIKTLVKYIELLHIVKPCTDSVLDHLLGMYEFYVYCVFLAFTPWEYQQKLLQKCPVGESVELEKVFTMYRTKRSYQALITYLFRINDELKGEYNKISSTPGETAVANGLLAPRLNDGIKLEDPTVLNAVYEKIVAVESCHYVFEVLVNMQPRIQECLNSSGEKDRLGKFLKRNSEALSQMAEYMYTTHPVKGLKLDTISDTLDGSVVTNSTTLEPSYYATRVAAIFQDLKERLSYQGGGSLPAYCQTKFLRCALGTVVDSVIEAYARNKKNHSKEFKTQTEFDLAWLGSELGMVVGEKTRATELLTEYVRLMNMGNGDDVKKCIFKIKDLTYNTVCYMIKNHPALENQSVKDNFQQFQKCIISQAKQQ